jgi:hypothetical protein
VFNYTDEDFQMYTAWWDTERALAFTRRHAEATQ